MKHLLELNSSISSEPCSGVTRALIGGGGGYIHIFVLLKTKKFKRNSSGRTRIYEYTTPPPPPPINALVTPLFGTVLPGGPASLCVPSAIYLNIGQDC